MAMPVNDASNVTSRKAYVFPPRLQDLSSWPPGENALKSVEMWEVSTPPDNSISWSIVLSYMIASTENTEWKKTLLGSDKDIQELMAKKNISPHKLNFRSIQKQVTNFNPFKNQQSFYYTKEVINIVRMFDLRLNRFANSMRTGADGWSDVLKLRAAARMLDCCLEVYETDSAGNKLLSTSYASELPKTRVILFQHTGIPKELKRQSETSPGPTVKIINIFAFGMSLKHVIPLRRDALGHILNRAKLPPGDISDIQREIKCDQNFLVSLLQKNSWHRIIPLIYASPYVAWKLTSAGFNTDPCCLKQAEFSAFYYTFGLDSTHLLHVLYNHASNSFEHSDKTTRNPDQSVLKVLKRIMESLKDDCSKSNRFLALGNSRDTALKVFLEIMRFNKYQIRIIEEINAFLGNCAHQASQLQSNSANAQRAKQIIILMFEMHSKYFYFCDGNRSGAMTVSEVMYDKFQNYVKFSEFYENLDNYSCLLFFDNFLHLELPTYSQNFTDTVLNLFLTVLSYSLFPKCRHGIHCSVCLPSVDRCALRLIPFSFRLNFLDRSKELLAELKCTPSGTGSSPTSSSTTHEPNSVVSKITSSLKSISEIKDQFLINRLRRYLEAAIDVSLSEDGIKGVLTIERALQVIGETLNISGSSDVIGHLLCSCLPEDAASPFFDIRNHCLSKYRPRTMQGRLTLETEIYRFEKLKDVIKDFASIVRPVYTSQKLRIQDYMIEMCLHQSQGIHDILYGNMQAEHTAIKRSRKAMFISQKGKYKLLTNNLLDYVHRHIADDTCYKNRKIGEFATLKFMFVFLADQCDGNSKQALSLKLQDLENLIKMLESKTTKNKQGDIVITPETALKMTKVVSSLRSIADSLFADVKEEPRTTFDFSQVGAFFNNAIGFSWFTDEEMSTIKGKVSAHLRKSSDALSIRLQAKPPITPIETQILLGALFLKQKDKKYVTAKLDKDPKKALKDLATFNDEKEKMLVNLEGLIRFTESDEGSRLLLSIDFPNDLDEKVKRFMNRKVELLLDRIRHLKSILVDGDEEISELWKWGRSEGIKAHTRYLMGQRFCRERDVRASLEMLLFDCMNILKTKESLKRLWTKANNLFSGASLRDVLSHGSTILETVGGLLDQDDLPSQFIDKMLELIEDGDALRTLSDLWEKSKLMDLKQFEDIAKVHADRDHLLRKWMQRRSDDVGGWKDYLNLLPLK